LFTDIFTQDDTNGQTVLHYIAATHRHELVEAYVKKHADQMEVLSAMTDHAGQTALMDSVMFGDARTVQVLVTNMSVDVNLAHQVTLETPLHFAVQKGNGPVLDVLLARADVQVNAQDKNGRTPLHLAYLQSFMPCVERLLREPEIDESVQDVEGKTAAQLAQLTRELTRDGGRGGDAA
jgi:ankyrin repeat protein